MKSLKPINALLVIIVLTIIAFLFYCTEKYSFDALVNIPNGSNPNVPLNSLSKLPSNELYISSNADVQLKFLRPNYDWDTNDLSEGRSSIILYSPNKLINAPAEDLLPRVTIVEMAFKSSEMQDEKIGWKRDNWWGANYRNRILKEKYGAENVTVINKEETIFKEIPCIHFKYKVKYPVSGKEAVTEEYCFLIKNSYYIVQLSRTLNDVNNDAVNEAFDRFLNSLLIVKSLIS